MSAYPPGTPVYFVMGEDRSDAVVTRVLDRERYELLLTSNSADLIVPASMVRIRSDSTDRNVSKP